MLDWFVYCYIVRRQFHTRKKCNRCISNQDWTHNLDTSLWLGLLLLNNRFLFTDCEKRPLFFFYFSFFWKIKHHRESGFFCGFHLLINQDHVCLIISAWLPPHAWNGYRHGNYMHVMINSTRTVFSLLKCIYMSVTNKVSGTYSTVTRVHNDVLLLHLSWDWPHWAPLLWLKSIFWGVFIGQHKVLIKKKKPCKKKCKAVLFLTTCHSLETL